MSLVQVIKDLYSGFPERMGKKLATRRRVANDVPVEKQLEEETEAEVDFLKQAGLQGDQIQKRLPTSKDPVSLRSTCTFSLSRNLSTVSMRQGGRSPSRYHACSLPPSCALLCPALGSLGC